MREAEEDLLSMIGVREEPVDWAEEEGVDLQHPLLPQTDQRIPAEAVEELQEALFLVPAVLG